MILSVSICYIEVPKIINSMDQRVLELSAQYRGSLRGSPYNYIRQTHFVQKRCIHLSQYNLAFQFVAMLTCTIWSFFERNNQKTRCSIDLSTIFATSAF